MFLFPVKSTIAAPSSFMISNISADRGRIPLLDYLRGSAMILVLLHHASVPYGSIILAFHMPLLFLLSGYTQTKSTGWSKKNYAQYIIHRFKRLMVPYFIFEFFNLFLWIFICYYRQEAFNLWSGLFSIFVCYNTPEYMGIYGRLWFLPCLFMADLLAWPILKRFSARPKYLFIFIGLAFGTSWLLSYLIAYRLPFTIDTALFALAFILLGYAGGGYIDWGLFNKHSRLFESSIVISCFVLLVVMVKYLKITCLMYKNYYHPYCWSVLGAVIGSVSFMLLVKLAYPFLSKKPILDWLIRWYSRNSLLVFPVHLEIEVFLRFILKTYATWYILFFAMLLGNIPLVSGITALCPFLNSPKIIKHSNLKKTLITR